MLFLLFLSASFVRYDARQMHVDLARDALTPVVGAICLLFFSGGGGVLSPFRSPLQEQGRCQ